MFTTFRSDVKFPPIIDSPGFKMNRYLGLCTKAEPYQSLSVNSLSTSVSTQSIPGPSTDSNTIVHSQSIENIDVPTFAQSSIQPMSIPTGQINRPTPGFIPPPPTTNIALLYKIGEQRQKMLSRNPSVTPESYDQDVEDNSNLSAKERLALALSKGRSGYGNPTQSEPQKEDLLDDKSRKKPLLDVSLFGGKKMTAGGFFGDDDEEEGATLLGRAQKNNTQETNSKWGDSGDLSTPKGQSIFSQAELLQDNGSMLESILKKKNAPTVIDEGNPFNKKLTKPKANLFTEEDDVVEQVKGKQDKFKDMLGDDSDEEEKQKKLLKKYGGTSTVAAPSEPDPKKRKNKLLEESDEEIPAFKGKNEIKKETKKKRFGDSDEDEAIPPPKKQPPKNKKVDFDDDDDPIPAKKPAKTKKLDEDEPVEEKKPKKEITEKVVERKKVESDEEKDQPIAEVRGSIKNNDFLSKLNSQLGQGPKAGIGLMRNDDNDYIDQDLHNDEVLSMQYRSQRGSIDQRLSIKPVAEKYFEQRDLGEVERSSNGKRSKKSSVILSDSVKDDRSSAGKEKEQSNFKKVEEPTMLRDKRKDPFADSDSEKETKTKPVQQSEKVSVQEREQEVEPVMLRGKKKKDPFDNSSSEEEKKTEVNPKRESIPTRISEKEPVMLRGKKKKDAFADSEEDDLPPLPKKPEPKVEPKEEPQIENRSSQLARKNKLLEANSEKVTEPVQPKEKTNISKPAAKSKRMLLQESSDEDTGPKPTKRPALDKKKTLLVDSDDDQPIVTKPKKTTQAAGKKKLFDDSD